jgi:hypothetical protein
MCPEVVLALLCAADLRKPLTQSLSDDVVYDIAGDVGKTVIASARTERQLGVFDPHQIQDGCVNIVNMDRLIHYLPSEVIGRTVGHAPFDASTRKPHGKAVRVVIATGVRPRAA